ncbi:hypothetical protein AVEN_169959-1 [Araneus ventricosus]|uniref:Uncharacterized protein n=1 Tax=Araneus ventricosus TaxID=182803 RepID=A0A4Y2M0G3_ARAVE|nr:hypothetical protein AVEN_169959-1 [Araneus ventricosus]
MTLSISSTIEQLKKTLASQIGLHRPNSFAHLETFYTILPHWYCQCSLFRKLPPSPNGSLQLSFLLQKRNLITARCSSTVDDAITNAILPMTDERYRYVESRGLALRPVSSALQFPL